MLHETALGNQSLVNSVGDGGKAEVLFERDDAHAWSFGWLETTWLGAWVEAVFIRQALRIRNPLYASSATMMPTRGSCNHRDALRRGWLRHAGSGRASLAE